MSLERFKDWLLQTRMARYPLATVFLLVAVLVAVWYFDPDLVRYLVDRFKPAPE